MSAPCPTCGLCRPVGLVAFIQKMVAAYYHVTPEEMLSDRRSRTIAYPRQVAMYLSREMTTKSLPAIGRCFGRDHTTVLHGIAAVEGRIAMDRTVAADIVALRERLAA